MALGGGSRPIACALMSVSTRAGRLSRGAWAVHALTASGAVLGFLAITSVINRRPLAAVVWLVAAQILDGLDGPLARAYGIDADRSKIDGWTLDLVVDYLTCVVVPALLLYEFFGFRHSEALLLAVAVLMSGALWFSRTDMCTEDHCFRGFPAAWNLIVPTLLLLRLPAIVDAAVVLGLCALSFTNVIFVHPVRVVRYRAASLISVSVWLATLLVLSFDDGPIHASSGLHVLLLGSSLSFAGITYLLGRQRLAVELA